MDPLRVGTRVGVVLAGFLALWLLSRLERQQPASEHSLRDRIRERLLFGLPIGTVIVVVVVASVYLFLQGGYGHRELLTIPFVSWSLRYPLGMITAPLAHESLGHLVSNLTGFLVFGSLAEYALGHYPRTRGRAAFDAWWSNPYWRAMVLFPGGTLLIASLTSLFAWGPIIGFSGVVFAAAGFALVHMPLLAVVGLLAREFLTTIYWTLRDPIVTASAGSTYSTPWWADVAVQTHLLGLLLGVAAGLAVYVVIPDEKRPSPWRLFVGSLLVGSALTLWALWWYQGTSSYRLFRGPGLLLLLGVALLLTVAASRRSSPVDGVDPRTFGLLLVLVPILAIGAVAVPINLTATGGIQAPGEAITVQDYEVSYGESVPDPRYVPVNDSVFESPDPPTATGVIVASQHRHLFTEAVSAGRLEDAGSRTVVLGGIGWRESITVERTGWRAIGGESTFRVSAYTSAGERRLLHTDDPAHAEATIDGRELAIRPTDAGFELVVETQPEDNATVVPSKTTLPEPSNTTCIAGLSVTRENETLVVERNRTRVPLFEATS
ncbi:MAG: rhomboid family intramembrane serine protease [Halodesulfurarchaeum sp.]